MPALTAIVAILLVVFVSLGLWGCPRYAVYQQELEGAAELARATQNRQIRIEEAKAEQESAKLRAYAEIERARGVAEANKIIGDSLKGNEVYLAKSPCLTCPDNPRNCPRKNTPEKGRPFFEACRIKHARIAVEKEMERA